MTEITTFPIEKNKLHRVFVYGTLLSNLSNWHRILKGRAKFVGIAWLDADRGYAMIDGTNGAYPYVVRVVEHGVPATVIKGEVYEVNQQVKNDLDALEGVPYHYIPIKDTIRHFATNEQEEITFYLAADLVREGTVVESGDWRVYDYNRVPGFDEVWYPEDRENDQGFFLSDDDLDVFTDYASDDDLSELDRLDRAFEDSLLDDPRTEHRHRFIS